MRRSEQPGLPDGERRPYQIMELTVVPAIGSEVDVAQSDDGFWPISRQILAVSYGSFGGSGDVPRCRQRNWPADVVYPVDGDDLAHAT